MSRKLGRSQHRQQPKSLKRCSQTSVLSGLGLASAASMMAMGLGIRPAMAEPSKGIADTRVVQNIAQNISQNPDFPDLPILQPASPLSAPVSVPPIDMRVIQELPVQPLPAQSPDQSPAQSIAPTPIEIPVVRSPEPPAVQQPVADVPEAEMPLEPPFIGEVNTPVVEAQEAPPFIEAVTAPVVEEPVVEVPVVEEPIVEVPVVEEPIVEVPAPEEPIVEAPVPEEPAVATVVPVEPLPTVEADASSTDSLAEEPAIATSVPVAPPAPMPVPADNSFGGESFDGEIANANPIEPVIPVRELPTERVTAVPEMPITVTPTATTNRWPEPVPFGQPLP
jgi:hypothetical protein